MSDNQVTPGKCLGGGLSISSQETRSDPRVERTGLLCGEKTGLEGNDNEIFRWKEGYLILLQLCCQ